jgi:hypothetical protein
MLLGNTFTKLKLSIVIYFGNYEYFGQKRNKPEEIP